MPNTQAPTHRLLDMIVEEVSLVDRAANKRRFLVVKRSEPDMADTADTTAAEAAPEESATSAPSEEGALDHSLLATAVTALESLTSTVELLSTVGGSSDPRLAPLAEGLKSTAEELLARAGITPTTEPAKPEAKNDLAESIAAARDAIAQLTALTTRKAEDAPSPAPSTVQAAPAASAKPSPFNSITEALGALTSSFQTLSESVKHQRQRLALVEKNVGLPNSGQHPEPVTKSAPAPTAWPLDLNHPMDRESVDKTVSFHDL